MTRTFKALALGAVLTATASLTAAAAPAADVAQLARGLSTGVIQVHGDHRACVRGKHGWHRHNRWGERRPCRRWRGEGRRPDHCVKIGPVWYCEY